MAKKLKCLHIEGRRWFDSKWGNTYHSTYIFANGELLVSLPVEYGYGDQFIETALMWLETNEYIKRKQYKSGAKEGGTLYVRETLKGTYSVIDVGRKRDL